MKKNIIYVFTIVMVVLLIMVVPSYGAASIGVSINNNPVTFNQSSGHPFIDGNNRTLVPLRQTMEFAGMNVKWDSVSKTATVSDNKGTSVTVGIGESFITKTHTNDSGKQSTSRIANDTSAQIIDNRTYLPIRCVLEAFNFNVGWDQISKSVVATTTAQYTNTSIPAEMNAKGIYSNYSSAVFYIEIYGRNGEPYGSGSGFFISPDGTAITNYHVIENAYSAKAMTIDGKTYDISGIYDYDIERDIAKIKVNGSGFPCVNVGNSDLASGGETVFAIGSPLGLENTISQGIISNPNRVLYNLKYFQITAPISGGSSGGALFDEEGNVIGITAASFEDGQNLNLAIPINSINALKNNTLTSLSSIYRAPASVANVSLDLTNTYLTLGAGETRTVWISYSGYTPDVYLEFEIDNSYVAEGTWGEWTDSSIPLYLTGLSNGSTDIFITLYDYETESYLTSKTLEVTCTSSTGGDYLDTTYYSGWYPVPDFGETFNLDLYDSYSDSQGELFVYLSRDVRRLSDNSLTFYEDLLYENGFYFADSYYDDFATSEIFTYDNYSEELSVGIYENDDLFFISILQIDW